MDGLPQQPAGRNGAGGRQTKKRKISPRELQSEYFAALHQVAIGLMRRRDLDSLLKDIAVRAADLLHTPNAFLYILTADGTAMEMRVGVGFHRSEIGARRLPGEGFVGGVWQSGKFSAEHRIWQAGPADGREGVAGTIIGVPLRDDRQVIGVLGFNILQERYVPSREEKSLLERFAELSFIAISNMRLYTELQSELAERRHAEKLIRQQNHYLELLHTLSLQLMTRFELGELLAGILDGACGLMETEHGYIYRVTADGEHLEAKLACGHYRGIIGKQLKKGQELSGRIWESGRLFVTDDYSREKGRNPDRARDKVRAWVGIPLKLGPEVLGVFCLAHIDSPRSFRSEEIAVLEKFAELAALALSNARLYEALEEELRSRSRVEAALRESETMYRTLAENLPGIVYRLFLRDNARVQFFNAMLHTVTGYHPHNLPVGGLCPLENIVLPADREKVLATIRGAVSDSQPFEAEYGIVAKNGAIRTVVERARPVHGPDGRPLYIEGVIMDVTTQKNAQDKLLYISTRDGLTTLYNRARFEEELDRIGTTGDGQVGIIVCDINGLKLVNDAMGHLVGDGLLMAAAMIIKDAFRRGDIVARIGGDEFAVIVPNATRSAVEAACHRIKSGIDDYNRMRPGTHLSLSIGYAVAGRGETSIRTLFREADNNMYREKLHHSQSARSAIIQTAMKLLEERDFLTEEHAERIDALVLKLARKIKLAAPTIAEMQLLAKFHDIGKVGIADHILLKPGPFTLEEKREMQRHCEIGCRIAQSSNELLPIADWILKHHEWWNGGGYPAGLRGEQIPLECRILAVVDAYDAMTSDRPYRAAMSHEQALAELERAAGTQFDPKIVKKFLSLLAAGDGKQPAARKAGRDG
jgi:diguanylate cyclase (GGDEF)-like protein/PAS domain S-box-containing protein